MLATHVADPVFWQAVVLREGGLDLAAMSPPAPTVEARGEALTRFDEEAEALRAAFAVTEDAALRGGGAAVGLYGSSSDDMAGC